MHVCLSACLPACLPACLSASLPLCLSASLPLCLSASLPLCLSVCLSGLTHWLKQPHDLFLGLLRCRFRVWGFRVWTAKVFVQILHPTCLSQFLHPTICGSTWSLRIWSGEGQTAGGAVVIVEMECRATS